MDFLADSPGRLSSMLTGFDFHRAFAGDPAQIAADWASRLGSSGDKIRRGVQAVQTAPGAAAARQADVWAANTANAKAKYASNVARVSLSDWQQAMTSKGVDRIASGASAAVPKMTAFLQQFLPYVDSARRSLPPRGSYEQNKARATAMMDQLHKFSRTGR